ncbi:AcrR family transcriptional regulator [Clostridium tetanomorphum]|uniref:TetR/AcrR family transcriptional regulator n=1 Tax=Clostridium tetanomorphum TaxID=1553 RepID=A0A923EBS6_CLOTT|nr:TetR/AcrR family transcriptional regulator [Clostridium tetanomorphum]KAJ50864.1 transcriptional regulator TetR family protein [Clostridium tetanomorphum DSM 665]MBC2398356.1 TetR/AcrR family transcriptional regulator [Clostridium tetanomorphum]MBP1865507.1 AcrR family transcriptional regulator [Clostridium tetanomorphum]NRS86453.1 AcrR family transcriptional regulator [Clostridium tetanomorphum]NRZ95518.1 AcrR family transcriptional regulator [Clostridium tetanomorphum]
MPKDTFFNLQEDKRRRIIDSAMREFSQAHYNRVTIDSIVIGAGIPKGSFYQYFRNKDDLYQYIFSQIGNEKKNILEKIKKDVEKLEFKDYCIKMLEEAGKFENIDPLLEKLKDKFINECPQELRKEVLKNELPKSYRLLEEAIRLYMDKGELRKDLKVNTSAYMITSCVVNLENYEFADEESIEDAISDMLETIIEGMKK